MATPEMVWLPCRWMEATAWSTAMAAPASPPIKNPSHGLPVKYPTAVATNAPIVIMPSMPMLSTPERWVMTPPSAAKMRGAEYIRVILMASRMLFNM